MLEYRNLTRYYTRKTISVSFIRSREKGDMHLLMKFDDRIFRA